jgi:predicted kinase
MTESSINSKNSFSKQRSQRSQRNVFLNLTTEQTERRNKRKFSIIPCVTL